MVLIFGWGAGEAQDFGEVAPVICPNCHNHVFLHHIRSDKRVSLFFVPLASYGSDEYLACPICRHGLQLRPEHRVAADRMQASTTLLRRGAMRQDLYQAKVDAFWRTLGVAPSGEQVVRPSPVIPPAAPTGAPPPPSPATGSLAHELEGLARLHAEGVLSDEEFAAAKRRVLGDRDAG